LIAQPFGHALSDETGRLIQVDRVVCELLGYEPPTLLGRTVEALTHPDDWAVCQRLLERLHAHDEPFSIAKRYLRRDGSAIWAHAYVTRLTDAAGRGSVSAMIRPVLPKLGWAGGPAIGCRVAAERAQLMAAVSPGQRLN